MTPPESHGAPDEPRVGARLRRIFVLIVLVEALSIAALYLFGRYFS